MVNQFGKFSSQIAELSQPLCSLLSSKQSWTWGPAQDSAFTQLKAELTRPTVLAHYCLTAEMKVSADASSYGLGAVLLQRERNTWRPVCFASRSVTETENRSRKRRWPLHGHAISSTTTSSEGQPQSFGTTTMCHYVPSNSTISHQGTTIPTAVDAQLSMSQGNYLLYVTDALLRAPLPDSTCKENLQSEVEEFIDAVTTGLTTTGLTMKGRLVLNSLSTASLDGLIEGQLKVYWSRRGHLTVHKGLLMYGDRIVVPKALQKDTLLRIHQGHLGIQRCKLRVQCGGQGL